MRGLGAQTEETDAHDARMRREGKERSPRRIREGVVIGQSSRFSSLWQARTLARSFAASLPLN